MTSNVQVYLGIGSNINAQANIDKALKLLDEAVSNLQQSPIYKNQAQGFVGDDFLNLVIGFEYSDGLTELQNTLQSVEQACGRQRRLESGKGSRTLDLDLLMFGDLQGVHCGIQLPRPEVFDRQFVWQPLLDLFEKKGLLSNFELSTKLKIESTKELMKTAQMVAV